MRSIIVTAAITAFILLAMYSLDYASEGYTAKQRSDLVRTMDKALADAKDETRQIATMRELYE